jgi:hypothetical protein
MSMFNLKAMKALANGAPINEAIENMGMEDLDSSDLILIDETLAEVGATLFFDDLQLDYLESIEKPFLEAMNELSEYMVANGLLNENFVVTNPKKNIVRLNKFAIMNRLEKIFTLKLARKAKDKNFKKYKIGTKLKRSSMKLMHAKYGNKAKMMAKKAFIASKKKTRIVAVADKVKTAIKGKK